MSTTKTMHGKPIGGSVITCPRCCDTGWEDDFTQCQLCASAGVLEMPLTADAHDSILLETLEAIFDMDLDDDGMPFTLAHWRDCPSTQEAA
jgi:hypothetical protein